MIRPGEHVFLEVGGCYRRYHTAMMRTAVNGALSDSMHSAQELLDDPAAYAAMARCESPYGDGKAAARIVETLRRDLL